MAIYKCKMCGGDLEILPGTTVCECEYCGTQQTVPSADSEKLMNLYNRANRLRFNNEFDKAAGVFESIVAEFPQEAEAYWGLCLCKYGIEYVDDPATAKKIPTCHRTSFDSIFEDSNFELALEYADVVANKLYREEAKEIDRIQRSILNIVKSEEAYDIFICYKETASDGQRTKDSVMAQDIYDALVAKGYKVFFARITLEDKLGQVYEPYIFAALSSAKIMLSIGTCYENFNAVWVKNEWSRFLAMMKDDKSKVLIPCYCDCDAYDMPQEFKNLQGQDMGKVGFIQDLVRGIGKIVTAPADKKKEETIESNVQTQTIVQKVVSSNSENLLKRGMLALEDEKWNEADRFFENVLNENVEEPRAYLGKLLCEFKAKSENDLVKIVSEKYTTLSNNANYKKAYRFGDVEFKAHLDELNKRYIYNTGVVALKSAKTKRDCIEVKAIFDRLSDYQPAIEKSIECELKCKKFEFNDAMKVFASSDSEEAYILAKSTFEKITNYEPAKEKAEECSARAKNCVYLNAYKILSESKDKEQLKHAMHEFERIGDFKDSIQKINQCEKRLKQIECEEKDVIFQEALRIKEANLDDIVSIRKAITMLQSISEREDARNQIEKCEEIIDLIKEKQQEQKRLAEKKQKKKNTILIIISVIIALCIILLIVLKVLNHITILSGGTYFALVLCLIVVLIAMLAMVLFN